MKVKKILASLVLTGALLFVGTISAAADEKAVTAPVTTYSVQDPGTGGGF
ncbi:hypothetical protein ACRTEV_21605 [Rossellomorea arthrocnemi]